MIAHTPIGCDTASKSTHSTALYDHMFMHMRQHIPGLETGNVIGLEDSKSGAASLSNAGMKSVGINLSRAREATNMLYDEAYVQLVVFSHAQYQEVLKKEATLPTPGHETPGARKVYRDVDAYLADANARLSPHIARGAAFDVDGVIFDSEPLVADAVVESLKAAPFQMTASQEIRIRHDIVGTSLPLMKGVVLPEIIGPEHVPPDFIATASAKIIVKYGSVEVIPDAFQTIALALKLFGRKGVEFVSNGMPNETREKFTTAHGIAVEVNHPGVLHSTTLTRD